MASPMGEPLATLPPRVPALRTGREAKRRARPAQAGAKVVSAAKASVRLAPAPMNRPDASLRMAFSASTAPR